MHMGLEAVGYLGYWVCTRGVLGEQRVLEALGKRRVLGTISFTQRARLSSEILRFGPVLCLVPGGPWGAISDTGGYHSRLEVFGR